jgi:NADH-quinone oxidoreductase subunit L
LFQHAHESPLIMTIPLIILSAISVVSGFALAHDNNLAQWISWGEHAEAAHPGHNIVMFSSLSAFAIGFVGAFWVYMTEPPKYEQLAARLSIPYRVLVRRYKFDELYLWFIDRVYYPLASFFAYADYDWLDQKIVDGVGRTGTVVSWLSSLFDYDFIDQILVDGNGDVMSWLGTQLRKVQSGLAQSYLFWMVLGLGGMLVWIAHNFK